jgi:hypothetical protein
MLQFRYPSTGSWFKGNTHIHSTASDGGKTFSELAEMYAAAGYHFLFRTDHWVASDVRADTQAYPLLWLDGIELDGLDQARAEFHVVGLGTFQGLQRDMGLNAAMQAVRAQNGLLILAHPFWMGNTLADAIRWQFDGVEVYNHVCQWLNGKGDGTVHWNAMLRRYPNTLALASDDAHTKPSDPGWNGGWVMVNAPECTPHHIMASLRAGNFYSSCGPEIYAIEFKNDYLHVQCSPVQFARLVGPASWGKRQGDFEQASLTEFSFRIPPDWPYMYIEIEDQRGRRAWTNTLFAGSLGIPAAAG